MLQNRMSQLVVFFAYCLAATALAQDAATADAKDAAAKAKPIKMVPLQLAGGKLPVAVPADWKAPKAARSRIIEKEFAVAPTEGDKIPGRLTMMRSGGSLKANIERWFGQFTQPDGKSTKDVAKVTNKKINQQDATIVDISGSFKETMGGGPFSGGKTVVREDYRMLGGIVQTPVGQYFFKLYGPAKTIAAAEPGFVKMMDSVGGTAKSAPGN